MTGQQSIGTPIQQLRYVRLGTADFKGAIDFAHHILGLELVNQTETDAYFRSDCRDHTLVYVADDPSHRAIGLEVRDPQALQGLTCSLDTADFTVIPRDAAAAGRRKSRLVTSIPMRAGYDIDLVVRPLQSGWRYHGPRDAGITGLEGVSLRGAPDGSDHAIWTGPLGGSVSDRVGDAAYIRFDDAHHRIAVHPSSAGGVLAIEFGVEDIDLLMRNSYFLRNAQVRIVGGPGRRPFSRQLFVTFAGPDGVLFSYVCEGDKGGAVRRPRQFPRARASFCAWGSETDVPEYR